jgi:CRP/FNR family cyclic AMP-dependent transcriptional regulator
VRDVEWVLLNSLSETDRQQVMRVARPRTFARNEVVFHEGDPGDAVHLIEEGHVSIRITTPLGDVATVRVLGPGDFFGELALVAPAPRLATVRAVEGAKTLVLHAAELDRLRAAHPMIDRLLIEAMSFEVRRLSQQLVEALYLPVTKRVRRRLVDLYRLYAAEGEPQVLPFTQDDIAGLAGSTRPTVNKELNELQDAGLIAIGRGRIEVLDPRGLARRAK